MKIVKVKMTLSGYICKIYDKEKIKEIVRVCVDYSQTLEFLDKAYVSLNNCGQDTFSSLATRIHDLYSELRKTISWLFMHFEKYLKQEISKNLSEIMDQAFYDKVVFPHKPRFSQDPSTKQIVTVLEKNQKQRVACDDSSTKSINFSYKGQNKYLGELSSDNEREGYGKISYFGGDSYEGYWLKGKRHGKGLYSYKYGGYYLGNFINDLPSGAGFKVFNSGNVYTGEFFEGKKQGQGEMVFKNGDKFEGNWDNDDMHGHGKYTWSSGDYYIGNFVRDKREGDGTLHLITGEIVEGVWKDGALINNCN